MYTILVIQNNVRKNKYDKHQTTTTTELQASDWGQAGNLAGL